MMMTTDELSFTISEVSRLSMYKGEKLILSIDLARSGAELKSLREFLKFLKMYYCPTDEYDIVTYAPEDRDEFMKLLRGAGVHCAPLFYQSVMMHLSKKEFEKISKLF